MTGRPVTTPLDALPLVDAAGARAGDEGAVAGGETWDTLMRRAARHLANGVISAAGGRAYGLRVVVAVGKGNNGGDGWAAAPLLARRGAQVTVVSLVGLDADVSDVAAAHRTSWLRHGRVAVGLGGLEAVLRRADVIVDCLLGTGASGPPRHDLGRAVEAINRARAAGSRIVACDIPTGVDSDTGQVHEPVVSADLTVTFGALKRGLLLSPGCWQTGDVVVGGLGPRWKATTDWRALTAAGAAPHPTPSAADKLAHGRVLLVTGSVGTAGAAVLATRAALAVGAGLVTLATPAHIQRVIAPVVPAAMTRPLRHTGSHVSREAVDELADVEQFDAVMAGPGLGPVSGTRAVVDHLLVTARRLVLDADALNVFRDDPAALGSHAGDLVVTPHERELARLGGGSDGRDAWGNRVARVPELAASLGATVVAKGPATIVAAPDGRVWVTPVGGPELGTGGTGDILAGMLVVAVATADDVPLAVARTAWRHGFAGHRIAARRGLARLGSEELAAGLADADGALVRLAESDPGWPMVLR